MISGSRRFDDYYGATYDTPEVDIDALVQRNSQSSSNRTSPSRFAALFPKVAANTIIINDLIGETMDGTLENHGEMHQCWHAVHAPLMWCHREGKPLVP